MAKPPGTPTVDISDDGTFGTVNDAVFATGEQQSGGAGFFSFVGLQHGPEQGYNSDHGPQFDEKPGSNSVLLASVPIVFGDGSNGTQDGVAYREFLLNLNEPNGQSKPYLSLDALQIWQEESGNLNNFTPGSGFAGTHTNYLAYNLDAAGDKWVGLTDGISHGSGQSEYRILIPDSDFINDAAHRYVTLYSQFGLQSGWPAEGGFEEWGLHAQSGGNVASLALTQTASVPGGTADTVGEVITYSFRLENVGNTSQTGVIVTDPTVSDLTRGADVVGNNDSVLNVGEVWSYTAHHTVTQADIDNNGDGSGVITNTATAHSTQAGPVSASASVTVEQHPTIEVTKTADVSSVDAAGDVINYTVTIDNVGTSNQTNPAVDDPQLTVTTPIVDFDAPILGAPLMAQLLNGDYNAGDTNQNGVEDPGETFQFFIVGDTNMNGVQDPGETFFQSNIGDTDQNGAQDPGEHFQFYNVGDTNKNGVEDSGETFQFDVSHRLASVDANNDGINDGDTNGDGVLNPGESWQYTVSYTVTQNDIDNGGVVDPGLTHDNTATASTDQIGGVDASASVAITQNPHLVVDKTAVVADGTADAAGDVINYSIAVTNDGNMSLTGLSVTDPSVSNLAAVISGGFNAGDTNHDGKLSVGETWQYTASHTVTQAEIDNGGVVDPGLTHDNTASASTDQNASGDDSASVAIVQDPHLMVAKSSVVADGVADAAGDVINYSIAVSNDGNMSLTGLAVTDPSVSNLAAVTSGGFNAGDANHDGKLSVGETWQYTASHTVTQADLDNGGVVDPELTYDNTATASSDQGASGQDTATTSLVQDPEVTLTKAAAVADGTADTAGDVINYSIAVTNDGNMSLTGVAVTDPSVSDLAAVVSGGHNAGDTNQDDQLSVGETWQYTASHTVTQAEIDAGGTIDNTASVSTDQGASSSDSASVAVVQPMQPLTLDMSLSQLVDVGLPGADAGGDIVQFFLGLTNNTAGTITNITVSDLLGDATPGSFQTPIPASLASGATWTTTYNHAVTAGDVSAGHVADDVTITALDAATQTQTVMAHWDTLF